MKKLLIVLSCVSLAAGAAGPELGQKRALNSTEGEFLLELLTTAMTRDLSELEVQNTQSLMQYVPDSNSALQNRVKKSWKMVNNRALGIALQARGLSQVSCGSPLHGKTYFHLPPEPTS